MSELVTQRLQFLQETGQTDLLGQMQHGIEKESLRIDNNSRLSQKKHPHDLGSTLTHPYITTDYSEALLEFITPVHNRLEDALQFLTELHQFTYQKLGNELLWAASMPGKLEGDEHIPIAEYGSSNIGRMKSVYREGLWHRYGKPMQTIAGIHYNYSLPQGLWSALAQADGLEGADAIELQSSGYFALIRNFRRYAWLLMYLFGASPATSRSFLPGCQHDLLPLHDDTLYLPYATSLRMSDLGYTNQAQAALNICFNTLSSYVESLEAAIHTPYPDYEKIGVKQDGRYLQLNTSILQIENEYYSTIRPKRIAASGEKPVQALKERGVEYIEVRCMDINPLTPLGIDAASGHFLDIFLAWCALEKSPYIAKAECLELGENFNKVVTEGRRPGLQLSREGQAVSLQEWGLQLLDQLKPVADMLDRQHQTSDYSDTLGLQKDKLQNSELTPSAQMLAKLEQQEFLEATQKLSAQHRETLMIQPLPQETQQYFSELAVRSGEDQKRIEDSDNVTFDQFLADYFQS